MTTHICTRCGSIWHDDISICTNCGCNVLLSHRGDAKAIPPRDCRMPECHGGVQMDTAAVQKLLAEGYLEAGMNYWRCQHNPGLVCRREYHRKIDLWLHMGHMRSQMKPMPNPAAAPEVKIVYGRRLRVEPLTNSPWTIRNCF